LREWKKKHKRYDWLMNETERCFLRTTSN
jgi:hypothetical protein